MNADEVVKELRRRGLSNGTTLGYHSGLFEAAADMIESLQAQLAEAQKREKAAVEDLVAIGDCRTCGNKNAWCDNPDRCKGYEWRGTHDGEGEKDGG